MLTDNRIKEFYNDLEILGLKRPVANLAEKTGFSKGTISEYLNKKRTPSENFIKAFYKTFSESLTKVRKEMAPPRDKITAETALLKVLLREFAEYKALKEGGNADEILKDIRNKAKLVLEVAEDV